MPDLEGFFSRVDAHLATLDRHEQAHFLERLTEQWQDRYATFQARVHRSAPTGTATAFDYIETLAGLDQRAGRIAQEAA